MDRERERMKESEPVPATEYDARMKALDAQNERQRLRPVVLRAKETPFEVTRQGPARYFLNPNDERLLRHSRWALFDREVLHHSGRHRHQGGLVIYVMDGEGISEVDGLKVAWRAGDILLLPIKPEGAAHQHFNKRPGEACKFMGIRYQPFDDIAGLIVTQLEDAPEYAQQAPVLRDWSEVLGEVGRMGGLATEAQGTEGRPPELFSVGSPSELATTSLFDWLVSMRRWQRSHRERSTWLIRGDDLPWESCPLGTVQWYLHPALSYTATYNYLFYRQRIAPGGRGARARHPGEQVTRVLKGRGYSMINGIRHPWEAGDVIVLPIWQDGVVYQHVNDGAEEVLLACCEPNWVSVMDIDRHSGWEVLEPATGGA